jgi:sec-independent protein translocase protein TatB
MLDVAPTELLLVAVVALVVIGPKDLPKAMRVVGQWVGRARGMARHFRSGIDEMIRQSELEEMEKKWREENERIMREFPSLDDQIMLPANKPEAEPGALPALAAPVEAEPAPTGSSDAEHAASYVAPDYDAPEVVSPQDLANWHDPAPVEPAAVVEPTLPEAEPAPPATSDRGEEQLSLLPPEPTPGAPKKAPK